MNHHEIDFKKKAAGEKAIDYIQDGMILGLGSGSTVYWMLKRLGELVKEGLQVKGIPSSHRTEKWAQEFGIPLIDFSEAQMFDLAIDGADEVDPHFNLIKGGGGSLFREKMVDTYSKEVIIIVDDTKMVERLGAFPLPVEVVPFGWEVTAQQIEQMGATPKLRMMDNSPYVSNNHNYIVDCSFPTITEPEKLHHQLKQMLGVVETGLFIGLADTILIGNEEGVTVRKK